MVFVARSRRLQNFQHTGKLMWLLSFTCHQSGPSASSKSDQAFYRSYSADARIC